MAAKDEWGPWAPDLDPCERRARLRSLRGIARILAGPRATSLCDALACAETDPAHLPRALAALDRLGTFDMRRIVGSYGGLLQATPSCAPPA